MRFLVGFLIFWGCGQWLSAQSDTLVGILKDVSQKAIKRYPVTLGSVNPKTVKTNGKGMFMFPGANLQDTLFVTIKKTKNQLLVPVNGYNYITITLENSTFNADRSNEQNEELQRLIMAERNRLISSSVMTREDIRRLGCRDMISVLKRMSGVTFMDGNIRIRASASLTSPTDPLVVVDGIPMDLTILDTIAIEDVQEVSVLKDAGQYGARGANGAIVIKTK